MDLNDLLVDEAVMRVKHPVTREPLDFIDADGKCTTAPDGKGQPLTIRLYNADSEQVRRLNQRANDAHREELRKGKTFTSREDEMRGLDLLARATKGWSAMPFRGRNLPFSIENAVLVYDAMPWLKRDVDEYIVALKNFVAASATT